jgi:hypothetical protein
MTLEEQLLVILAEECAEVQKAITKALRFGLDDSWRDCEFTDSPRNMIQWELSDIMAVSELLAQIGTLSYPITDGDLIEAKKIKVRKFLEYSRQHGRLSE